MFTLRMVTIHIVVILMFGTAIVAAPIPVNIAAFLAWLVLVWRWSKRPSGTAGLATAKLVVAAQLAGMIVLVIAAVYAPIKVVEGEKSPLHIPA